MSEEDKIWQKAIRVVDSCENEEQLKVARRYIDLAHRRQKLINKKRRQDEGK